MAMWYVVFTYLCQGLTSLQQESFSHILCSAHQEIAWPYLHRRSRMAALLTVSTAPADTAAVVSAGRLTANVLTLVPPSPLLFTLSSPKSSQRDSSPSWATPRLSSPLLEDNLFMAPGYSGTWPVTSQTSSPACHSVLSRQHAHFATLVPILAHIPQRTPSFLTWNTRPSDVCLVKSS